MMKKEHEPIEIPTGIEEKQPSVAKRIFIVCLGIFLLLLMLSYFLMGPYTFSIIESMALSSKMEGHIIIGDGFSVVFDEIAYSELKDHYLWNQQHEFKACLSGEINQSSYIVKEVMFPEQRGSFARVVYAQCPAGTIVSLHSHPYRRCRASEQDFRSFEKFRETNPDAVMMIMCEADRFYVYR